MFDGKLVTHAHIGNLLDEDLCGQEDGGIGFWPTLIRCHAWLKDPSLLTLSDRPSVSDGVDTQPDQ